MTEGAAPPILLVDDDASNRVLLRTFLASAGYAVAEAGTGEEALQLIERKPFSLVLLDVMLPGLSGFEVCQRIKQDPNKSGIPVIMVTALGDAASRTRAFESDADEFLAKPVFRPELMARVRSILHLRQMQMEKEAALVALEQEKRTKLQSLFERYMSKAVAEHLLKLPESERVALLQHQRRVECTVMFTDVRNFTAMSDVLPPREVVGVLNEHFDSITEIAHRHGGTIFNMTGDGLLIGFGVPIAQDAPARAALIAALEMQRDFATIRDKVQQRYNISIGLGIGISHGTVIMGNVGSDRFVSFTIIGDAVNVASRIQALADPGQIVLTQSVQRQVTALLDGYDCQQLDVTLRGKARDQVLYRVAVA